MHQLYITKMVMLIFFIIAMGSYLVCLVCQVLKNICFREYLSVLPNIAYAIGKTILRKLNSNLEFVLHLKITPMKKAWFIATMEKALWSQLNTSPWFLVPMEKGWFYERLFFKVVIVMIKD